MYDYKVPVRFCKFLLNEVFEADKLWPRLPGLADQSTEISDAVLDEAARLVENDVAPLNRKGDEAGLRLENGEVITPEGFREAYRKSAEGGWASVASDAEHGGQGMSNMLGVMVSEMFSAANNAFSLYVGLTSGATLSIEHHGSEELKQTYLPQMYSGNWAGCMCLTESHAGTDLGIMRTRALPQADGSHRITGTKIFITGGEHDLSENIIYLVLAKLPDAPAGSKGISLFLVPKFLVQEDGSVGERNGVSCASLEHKMGIKASSTCVMEFEDAVGYMIGEPNQGLAAMFTMMNHERLAVGMQGLGCSEAAYQKARAYAMERVQGRALTGPANPDGEADPIIVHPDVRRMLMIQKSLIEGGRAFAAYVGLLLDVAERGGEEEEARRASDMVEVLTPITKAFLTDRGLECCVLAQQVFGGHGYIREWGVEQLVRDVRITQIYEGTNGIQALDLMGRKVARNGGANLQKVLDEMRDFIAQNESAKGMGEFCEPLKRAIEQVEEATRSVLEGAASNLDEIGAASVDYLDLLGYTILAWMWARMAAVALAHTGDDADGFYASKLSTARFYMRRVLPRNEALLGSVCAGSETLMALPAEQF